MEDLSTPAPYPHWMLREIHEQPAMLERTLAEYVGGDLLKADAWADAKRWIETAKAEILIAASGSSRHAGMVAELLLEDLAGIAVDVEYASEYVYRSEKSLKNASVLLISQSGETADTLAALRKATGAGHATLTVSNVAGSSMAQLATVSVPTQAGRERAVPATKSFTAQLLTLYLLALAAAEVRGTLAAGEIAERLRRVTALPAVVRRQLAGWQAAAESCARHYAHAHSFLFLGRGLHYPIAREGALKLKESAYLHAEGYPSGELKHGPNALVGEGIPLVMIATVDRGDAESVERYQKVVALMQDLRRQGADILAVCNAGDADVMALSTQSIPVEEQEEPLLGLCEVIPLQLFSYFMAIQAGIDVDHPRNLTKAVLAE